MQGARRGEEQGRGRGAGGRQQLEGERASEKRAERRLQQKWVGRSVRAAGWRAGLLSLSFYILLCGMSRTCLAAGCAMRARRALNMLDKGRGKTSARMGKEKRAST